MLLVIAVLPGLSCSNKNAQNKEMITLLSNIAESENSPYNTFASETKLKIYDSVRSKATTYEESASATYGKANTLLELGREEEAITLFEDLLNKLPAQLIDNRKLVMKDLAIACLRLGERQNCIYNHTGESCIFPIANGGIHVNKRGAEKAIELYQALLKYDPTDLESRWLLNIAYMAIGQYPEKVPAPYLIKVAETDSDHAVKPFTDVATNIGLNVKNMAGGSIIDDFNNDGYPDIVTSSWGLQEGMHYFINNTDGTFSDASASSGLKDLTGGLNIVQTDYNNDGLKDVFVLRGAWKGKYGKEPNSLLKNNGDGTFTDVTRQAGLLSFYPTQTATWADFNNDGWLDVFIGNETSTNGDYNPCELYLNNKNGTFTEVASKAGCAVIGFVKGVTSGDYDNDGLTDIFISTLGGKKILLKNEGTSNGTIHFKDVSQQTGVGANDARTFTTWFWDYDNDGWLDILVCGYEFYKSLSWYTAAEALNMPVGNSGRIFLFHNKHDGTFEDVSEKSGLCTIAFAMGGNFGDIDNDGYSDFYLGTGNPQYTSLVPNKMFRNINGTRFADVTASSRTGNLQKGHGVSFVDLDNDGNEDVYIDMGGAYVGDAYDNALYLNPGQSNNHYINISLEGVSCNRSAIGARIKLTFTENGSTRSVYRDVNSGGSFGSNPLMQHLGIGQATAIDQIEIKWPGSNAVQTIKNLPADKNIKIKQGDNHFAVSQLKRFDFKKMRTNIIDCYPLPKRVAQIQTVSKQLH